MGDGFATVDEYIASFPSEVRAILEEIRDRVRDVVQDGEETISYQIPTIKLNGKPVVYFAAWKEHVSLYPLPKSEEIRAGLEPYKSGKGTVRFPIDQPIPYELVEQIVRKHLEERFAG